MNLKVRCSKPSTPKSWEAWGLPWLTAEGDTCVQHFCSPCICELELSKPYTHA